MQVYSLKFPSLQVHQSQCFKNSDGKDWHCFALSLSTKMSNTLVETKSSELKKIAHVLWDSRSPIDSTSYGADSLQVLLEPINCIFLCFVGRLERLFIIFIIAHTPAMLLSWKDLHQILHLHPVSSSSMIKKWRIHRWSGQALSILQCADSWNGKNYFWQRIGLSLNT